MIFQMNVAASYNRGRLIRKLVRKYCVLRPIHSRRDADATRMHQMFNVLLINGHFHSRRDADATRTPQSRDKIVLTFWSVPLFSRKGNSLLAVYHMRRNRAIRRYICRNQIPRPPSASRPRRVYYELGFN